MKIITSILLICILFFTPSTFAQVNGCTDPLATNYDFTATNNDGSCIYSSTTISPVTSVILDSAISETSGLISWNDKLWTHNDNSDVNLYSLDTLSGTILQSYPMPNVINYDWEEISQDSDYVYIGDFGNNVNGNRVDLKILRVNKSSLLTGSPIVDTIFYSYSDQIDFTPTGGNNTDFDCESMIVSSDSIFLFTKQWVSNKAVLYSFPKLPGTYSALRRAELDVQGMITGATYQESKRLISLCGYTNLLQPFIYLLYDFTASDFFNGNKRRLDLSLPFHQVEGIASADGIKYYCSNEAFVQAPFINTPQKLHAIDLTSYLENYLNQIILTANENLAPETIVFPNPSTEFVFLENVGFLGNVPYSILDLTGRQIFSGEIDDANHKIGISFLSPGVYFINSKTNVFKSVKFVKE